MTYASNLGEYGHANRVFIVLGPRVKINDSTLFPLTHVSGVVYSTPFSFGRVHSVSGDGSAYTKASSQSLSDGAFFYDVASETLYIVASGGVFSETYVIAEFDVFLSDQGGYWHADPTDAATETVYFKPLLVKEPELQASLSDVIFGFIPSSSSSMEVSNDGDEFWQMLYYSSFNLADFSCFHLLGELAVENIKRISYGRCGNISVTDETWSLQCVDRYGLLDIAFQGTKDNTIADLTSAKLVTTDETPNVDPRFVGRPYREIFGQVHGAPLINVDYNDTAPTTSNNRKWRVNGAGAFTGFNLGYQVAAGGSATKTYLAGLSAIPNEITNSRVFFDRASGTDEYPIITGAGHDGGGYYITHLALGGGAMAALDVVHRHPYIQRLYVRQNQIDYEAYPVRDYSWFTGTGITRITQFGQITFGAGLEASLVLPDTLSPNDTVYASLRRGVTQVVGSTTLGAGAGNLAAIIASILVNQAGISASDLDEASFAAIDSALNDVAGFSVPATTSDDFPDIKSVIAQLLLTGMLRLFINANQKWELGKVGPLEASVASVDKDTIKANSFQASFEYNDLISDVVIEYGFREVPADPFISTSGFSRTSSSNELTRLLHRVSKQKTFQSLHDNSTNAKKLADRLSYILGDRLGKIAFDQYNELLTSDIGNAIDLVRDRIPGFAYVSNATQTRSASLIEIKKSSRGVGVTLDDQKGIQDNGGAW